MLLFFGFFVFCEQMHFKMKKIKFCFEILEFHSNNILIFSSNKHLPKPLHRSFKFCVVFVVYLLVWNDALTFSSFQFSKSIWDFDELPNRRTPDRSRKKQNILSTLTMLTKCWQMLLCLLFDKWHFCIYINFWPPFFLLCHKLHEWKCRVRKSTKWCRRRWPSVPLRETKEMPSFLE